MQSSVTPEQELQNELVIRTLPEREALLMRSYLLSQEMLRNAMWEIMRLESLLELQQQ
jgi:hypothetical protein